MISPFYITLMLHSLKPMLYGFPLAYSPPLPLPLTEMKVLLAAIYSNYSTTIVSDIGIEHMDAYVAAPRGNQLLLKFQRLSPNTAGKGGGGR